MSLVQLDLLEPRAPVAPPGFAYRDGLIPAEQEADLVACFAELPFREFEFHGFLGRRRTVSFGLRYDFADSKVHIAAPLPEFLLPLRERAAAFAGIAPASIEHALITEYTPGTAIGWHRDRPVFGDVVGISFLSACRLRFRRRKKDPQPNPPPQAGAGATAPLHPHPQAGAGRLAAGRATGWQRLTVTLEPRSAYILRGAVRHEWEHSIPSAEELRYSVTFRTARAR